MDVRLTFSPTLMQRPWKATFRGFPEAAKWLIANTAIRNRSANPDLQILPPAQLVLPQAGQ